MTVFCCNRFSDWFTLYCTNSDVIRGIRYCPFCSSELFKEDKSK
jgi:hypothetical protein